MLVLVLVPAFVLFLSPILQSVLVRGFKRYAMAGDAIMKSTRSRVYARSSNNSHINARGNLRIIP